MSDDRITKIARIIERVQQTRLNENGAAWIGEWAPAAAHEIIALFTISDGVRGRLIDLAESYESGARISDVVVAAFQSDLDAFTSNTRDITQTFDVRLIRAVVDEKSNSERLLKDAKALRAILAATNTGEE